MQNFDDKNDQSKITLKDVMLLLAGLLLFCIVAAICGGIIAALSGSGIFTGAVVGLVAGTILVLIFLMAMTDGGAG